MYQLSADKLWDMFLIELVTVSGMICIFCSQLL